MIADWIYNNPTWLWGPILVALAAGVGGLGLLAVHRLVHIEVRRAHNELAGFLVAVISVTYAVLLAFIAVATWESFSHAQDIVDNEADYVGSIYLRHAGTASRRGPVNPRRSAAIRHNRRQTGMAGATRGKDS